LRLRPLDQPSTLAHQLFLLAAPDAAAQREYRDDATVV
jgi:hypothetical protein